MIRMLNERKALLFPILKYAGIVLFLLILLLPAKYLNTIYGYLPFLFAIFILLTSAAGMMILRRSMAVESDFDDTECMRGESVRISLKVRNRSLFVCPRAKAVIYISDLFGNSDDETEIRFAMTARAVSDFSFDMDMLHLGAYHVGIKQLSVYDMTGLFHVSVPISGDFRVNVGPRIRTLEELEISDDVIMESETDTRVSSVGGMNYTGVREYEFGDSMKQIHWKLSAHSSNYMTKINEINRQNDYVIIVDMASMPYEAEELMDIYDCLIETAVAILEQISDSDVVFSLLFPNRSREVERWVPSGGSYSEMIRECSVLMPNPDPEYPDGVNMLIDEGSMMNRSANVILCTSRVTDDLVQELIHVRQQNRSPELFYVFPERLTEREREKLSAPLEELGGADIRYHMISTAVNRSFMEEDEDGLEWTPFGGSNRPKDESRRPDEDAQASSGRTFRSSNDAGRSRNDAGRPEDSGNGGSSRSRSERPGQSGRPKAEPEKRSAAGRTVRSSRSQRSAGTTSQRESHSSRSRQTGGERK